MGILVIARKVLLESVDLVVRVFKVVMQHVVPLKRGPGMNLLSGFVHDNNVIWIDKAGHGVDLWGLIDCG